MIFYACISFLNTSELVRQKKFVTHQKKKEQHNTDSTPHYNTYQDFFCGFFLIYNHFESKIRIITIINTGFPYDIIQAIIVKTNCHERYLFKNRTKKHRNSQIHRSKPLK